MKGDKVYLQLESTGDGGLINSDWFILKFFGYKRNPETFVKSCDLFQGDGSDTKLVNCITENDEGQASVINESPVSLNLKGGSLYRVSLLCYITKERLPFLFSDLIFLYDLT